MDAHFAAVPFRDPVRLSSSRAIAQLVNDRTAQKRRAWKAGAPLLVEAVYEADFAVTRSATSPVDGSMMLETRVTLLAGKPPQRACSKMMSASGAT